MKIFAFIIKRKLKKIKFIRRKSIALIGVQMIKKIVSTSADHNLKIWNSETGKRLLISLNLNA